MRATLLLTVVAAFSACSSIKDYEWRLHGSAKLNLNEEKQPNSVEVKVLRLKGNESATAFEKAPFEELWSVPPSAKGLELDRPPQTLFVPADDEKTVPLKLEQVPPEVTHIGVLGLFNGTTTKDRILVKRDEFDAAELWLYDYAIDKKRPAAPAPTDATKPGS